MSRQIPAFVTKHACLERMWNFGMFVMERIDKASLKQVASSLTLTTLLSIVPALAVIMAAFSAFLLLAAYYVFRRKRIRKEEELKLAQSYIDGLERERTRLAKDLHDGVCNDLLGIGMNMQYMQPTDESKREILALLEQVRSDVRCISHELMPPKFQVTTLAETVEAYVEVSVRPFGQSMRQGGRPK